MTRAPDGLETIDLDLLCAERLVLPLVIEGSKWIRRRRAPKAAVIDARQAVSPARARTEAVA